MEPGQHIHELLHVAAASLFVVAGASALLEYRNLRERVVLAYGAMCGCAAAYACHVVISHNLPKQGTFWIPWTSLGLVVTFGATFFYLVAMGQFVGARGRLFRVPLIVQLGITVGAVANLVMYAFTNRSFLFVPVPRTTVGANQYALGEGAYSLLPPAEAMAALFMLSFVFGVGYLLVHLLRTKSRERLVYLGLCSTTLIVMNDSLVAMGAYGGVYLIAFTKAFETVRIHRYIHVRSRERIERRLRQAEKMEAIGRMAGGIAHDFKNILTAVGGSVELAKEVVDADHPAAEDLQAAEQAVDHGQRLVGQLLDVARSKETQTEYVDLNAFLSETVNFLSSVALAGTKLELQVDPELGGVMMSRGELTRVLMNLVINAREAMPQGGTIQIRASAAPRTPRLSPVGSPSEVQISVVDQGHGIPQDVLEHIFEPFFTTKAEHGGSGLGLATIYSIVHNAGGQVEVESHVGRGTSFHIRLPRSAS